MLGSNDFSQQTEHDNAKKMRTPGLAPPSDDPSDLFDNHTGTRSPIC